MTVSIESIECLKAGLCISPLGRTENNIKETLMQYILNPTNVSDYKYLLHKKTAKFLVDLSLKKWPEFDDVDEKETYLEDGITDIHLKTLMTTILVAPTQNVISINTERSYSVDFEIYHMLTRIVHNFVTDIPDTLEILIGTLVLLTNILSYSVDYGIVDKNVINNSPLVGLIIQIFRNENVENFNAYRHEREVMKLLECINNLEILFSYSSTNKEIISLVKNIVPVQLLKSIFILLTELQGKCVLNCWWIIIN